MFETMPLLMTATYVMMDDYHASVRIKSHADAAMRLTLVHESTVGMVSYDLPGNGHIGGLMVQDAEALIIVARRQGAIVATQVLEMDASQVAIGYLFVPRGGFNVLLEQRDALLALDDLREREEVRTQESVKQAWSVLR